MIRQMVPGDEARLEQFLARYPDSSMFLRSNLAAHGLGASTHPHATTYYASMAGDDITGVLGVTQGGYLMVQAPHGIGALPACVHGGRVIGMTGEADQVRPVLSALGLDEIAYTLLHDEPLCAKDLRPGKIGFGNTQDKVPCVPKTTGDALEAQDECASREEEDGLTLRRASSEDQALLEAWFAQYMLDTGQHDDPQKAREAARERAAQAPDRPDLRILTKRDASGAVPVGMTDFNARIGEVVQIGGVFVVPDHRDQGLAGRMLLAHLAEAHAEGARRAVLFANNPQAFRAYASIGFEQVGSYRVALFAEPQEVRP